MIGIFAVILVLLAAAVGGRGAAWAVGQAHRPGPALQAVHRPPGADLVRTLETIGAALGALVLFCLDPSTPGPVWAGLVLVTFGLAFDAFASVAGLERWVFYDHGLWWGRRWIPYQAISAFEAVGDTVFVVVQGRRWAIQPVGPLRVEVRLRLAVEGWG